MKKSDTNECRKRIEDKLKATDKGRLRFEEAESRITRWVADRHHEGEDAMDVAQRERLDEFKLKHLALLLLRRVSRMVEDVWKQMKLILLAQRLTDLERDVQEVPWTLVNRQPSSV